MAPKTKYLVYKANIMDDDGNKVLAGEVVSLGPKLARHYGKLGFLRPHFSDDEEDPSPPSGGDSDIEVEDAQPPRRSRIAPQPTGSELQTGVTQKPL